ncbi:MAG: hypothetical protein A2001_13870 [Treponema sp. GWC1_61_84]|nr:MAG: hypothetical protein A2001_13870 [Treponema sp. GWC1_61_84]
MKKKKVIAFSMFPHDMIGIEYVADEIGQNLSLAMATLLRLGLQKILDDNIEKSELRKLFFELEARSAAEQMNYDEEHPRGIYSTKLIDQ